MDVKICPQWHHKPKNEGNVEYPGILLIHIWSILTFQIKRENMFIITATPSDWNHEWKNLKSWTKSDDSFKNWRNWNDAKYCQMAFRSVLVHLLEILEELLFGTPGQTKNDANLGLCLHSMSVFLFFPIGISVLLAVQWMAIHGLPNNSFTTAWQLPYNYQMNK